MNLFSIPIALALCLLSADFWVTCDHDESLVPVTYVWEKQAQGSTNWTIVGVSVQNLYPIHGVTNETKVRVRTVWTMAGDDSLHASDYSQPVLLNPASNIVYKLLP